MLANLSHHVMKCRHHHPFFDLKLRRLRSILPILSLDTGVTVLIAESLLSIQDSIHEHLRCNALSLWLVGGRTIAREHERWEEWPLILAQLRGIRPCAQGRNNRDTLRQSSFTAIFLPRTRFCVLFDFSRVSMSIVNLSPCEKML